MEKEDVVLDPFLGSVTTSFVANKYGVGSIGIEKMITITIYAKKE